MGRRLALVAVGLLVGLRILSIATILGTPEAYRPSTGFAFDTARYHAIAQSPGTPYQDFAVEFPPTTVAFLEVIDGDTVRDTMPRLAWATLGLDLLAALAVAYGWGRRASLAYLALGVPFALWPFVYFRVDFLAVALVTGALALVKRRKEVAGGVTMAVAVFAKLWPVGVIPLLLVQRRRRAFLTCVATSAVGALSWLAWAGPAGPEQVLTFRNATGWQIESVVGSIVRVVTGSSVYLQSGATRTGEAPMWASALLVVGLVATVGATWWRVARSRGGESGVGGVDDVGEVEDGIAFGVAPLVATVAFLVFAPILSPQYLVWLLPFAAICWVAGHRRIAYLVGLANVLTMLMTRNYLALNTLDVGAHALLFVRNGVLILVGVEGWRLLRRLPLDATAPRYRLSRPVWPRAGAASLGSTTS